MLHTISGSERFFYHPLGNAQGSHQTVSQSASDFFDQRLLKLGQRYEDGAIQLSVSLNALELTPLGLRLTIV